MDALLAQVKNLALQADDASRTAIVNTLRGICDSLETPDHVITRLWGLPAQAAINRTAIDLKIFTTLAASKDSMSVQQILTASGTSADPLLLARLLRALASFGTISETGVDEFAANQITKYLAIKGYESGLKFNFDGLGPMFQMIPSHLAKTGYKNIIDANDTVFQDAHDTKQSAFEWLLTRPELFQQFNEFMVARRENQITWLDVYPLSSDLNDVSKLSADRALFVDVGGNVGHRCADLKARYPEIPGQVVLQDLPFVVANALPTPGVTAMAHDFTTPQPIKGAKFYYLAAVLHDWPDAKCQIILKHVIDAMADDSIILVDDMVSPNKGVNWPVTLVDITMMSAVASRERTEADWNKLYESAGLRILRRLVYTPYLHESITALVRK